MSKSNTMEPEVTLESVLEAANLKRAWKAVKANAGAAGVDGRDIEQTHSHLKAHWESIAQKLKAGQYRPGAIRAVPIPKPNGGTRTLGIPNVQDRLIQQAILQVLTPVFDPGMSAHSYGFRPGRSTHDALDAARAYVAAGKTWVVDIDLKSYFDQINHDKLMHAVASKVRDKPLLRLIGDYLRAPMQGADGSKRARERGTPQGGPLSPLLANIYLHPLDVELEKRGIAFVRYADDIALFAGSERAARRLLASVVKWIEEELKIEVNRDKSGTGPSDQTQLLGFRIHREGDVSVAPKALKRLKERVREIWERRRHRTKDDLKQSWRSYIDGWWNYFGYANWQAEVRQLSGWIRRHVRKYYWQRWHNRQGRANALRRLGVRGRGLGVAGCSCGAWPMSRHVVVQQALKTQRLNRAGFGLPWELASGP
jgi:RNA-directed DNA polymerase